MRRIKQSKIWEEMERQAPNGSSIPFSFSFVKKKTGAIVNISKATCTSIHSKGSTVNILIDGEIRPKSIRKCLIITFNSASVYL